MKGSETGHSSVQAEFWAFVVIFTLQITTTPVDHGGTWTTEKQPFSPGSNEGIYRLQQTHGAAEEEFEGDPCFLPGDEAELQQHLCIIDFELRFSFSGNR